MIFGMNMLRYGVCKKNFWRCCTVMRLYTRRQQVISCCSVIQSSMHTICRMIFSMKIEMSQMQLKAPTWKLHHGNICRHWPHLLVNSSSALPSTRTMDKVRLSSCCGYCWNIDVNFQFWSTIKLIRCAYLNSSFCHACRSLDSLS